MAQGFSAILLHHAELEGAIPSRHFVAGIRSEALLPVPELMRTDSAKYLTQRALQGPRALCSPQCLTTNHLLPHGTGLEAKIEKKKKKKNTAVISFQRWFDTQLMEGAEPCNLYTLGSAKRDSLKAPMGLWIPANISSRMDDKIMAV